MWTRQGDHPVSEEVWTEALALTGLGFRGGERVLEARRGPPGVTLTVAGHRAEVVWGCRADYLRGLGLLAGWEAEGREGAETQTPVFEDLGMMADCSRNAVLSVAGVKKLIRTLALLGYRSLQLYTEDTFEVPGRPYFGSLRGRYTASELKALDADARAWGLELVPCIQTLGHLGAALKWKAFDPIADTEDTLLVDEDETYRFLDELLATVSACFQSRRINLGLDEVHRLGLGKHLTRHGYEPRLDLMVRHLGRVLALCQKYGFEPMMWSDMWFRMLGTTGDYDPGCDLAAHPALRALPPDLKVIYWDYYNQDRRHYDQLIARHQLLPCPLVFAGGAWKWRGLVPDNAFSLDVGQKALESCRDLGVTEVILTAWGDDGAEASVFSVLPVIVQWAEFTYRGRHDEAACGSQMRNLFGAEWDDFLLLGEGNHPVDNPGSGHRAANPAKYLFYQDPLLGLFDAHVTVGETAEFYAALAERVAGARGRNRPWELVFEPIELAYRVLALKADLGAALRQAHEAGDRKAFVTLVGRLEALGPLVRDFHRALRRQWLAENKPSGLEVLDQRTGGLLLRLETAAETCAAWRDGLTDRIEELAEERLDFDCRPRGALPSIDVGSWFEMVSPNRIART